MTTTHGNAAAPRHHDGGHRWLPALAGALGWIVFALIGLIWLTATADSLGATHTQGTFPW